MAENFWQNKRVLITGGGGFLGSFVVENLKKRGAVDIFIPRKKDYDLTDRGAIERVEVAFPIEDPAHIRHIRDTVLDAYLQENARARFMQSDGSYVRNQVKDKLTVDIQELLISEYRGKRG